MEQVKAHKFYRVQDVSKMLSISECKAYEAIRNLNKELKEKGKIVIAGRVSAKYFEERMY